MKFATLKPSFLYEKIFTSKITELISKFQIVRNKARQNCLFQIIIGLIKSRKVQMHCIAESIKMEGDTLQLSSIVHRIEDFFREVTLNYKNIALLLLSCLGKGKIRLCIDRTEWDFGTCRVNILMVIACNGACQVPLYWELLDNKSGNSNTTDRIDLLEKVIALVGIRRIGILIADREFIGHKWLKYLKDNQICFCIRVPKHHKIIRAYGSIQSAEALASEEALYLKDCIVDGVCVQVMLKKTDDGDLLFLIGNTKSAKYLGQIYRKRWSIETLFQSFKQRGFDLESTHIKALDRLKKLVAVVSIAFSFCISSGIYYHEKVQKIKVKKHGYKEKSFCRKGIDFIQELSKTSVEIFEGFILKLLRFLAMQQHQRRKNNDIMNSISIT